MVFYDAWKPRERRVDGLWDPAKRNLTEPGRITKPGERAALKTIRVASYPMEATADAGLGYSQFEVDGLGGVGREVYAAPDLVVGSPTR